MKGGLEHIKVVGFDFDNTLVDEPASLRERWHTVLMSYTHAHEALERTFFRVFETKGHTYPKLVDDTLALLNLPPELALPIIEAFRASESTSERVYENAYDVITHLKDRGYRLGVITDGVQAYQEKRLQKTRLSNLFDFVYYGDHHQKPDPESFLRCIRDEGIEPNALLYIGDNYEKDALGATKVGARGVLISRNAPQTLPANVEHFDSMQDFLVWLKQ